MTGELSPTDRLIEAWVCWDATPGARLVVTRKLELLRELGMHSSRAHEMIARLRRDHRYSIPSAVQFAVNELAHHQLRESA